MVMTSAKPNGLSLLLLWINRIYKMIYTDMKCDIIRWDPYLCPCKASGNELSIIRYIMVVKDGLSKNKNRKRQLCRNLCRTQYKRHMRTLSHAITMSPRGALTAGSNLAPRGSGYAETPGLTKHKKQQQQQQQQQINSKSSH